MRYAVASSGACRRTSSSHDRLVSSIAAHSSPRGSTPSSAYASSGTRRATLPNASSPSASARRRAGSMVSTSTLPPRRAAAVSADAAATDVLPTPPEPQNTTTSARPASSASQRGRRIAGCRSLTLTELLAERLGHHAGDPQPVVADEQVRQRAAAAGRPPRAGGARCTDRLRRIDTARRAASSTAVAPGPARSCSSSSGPGLAQRVEHRLVGVGEQLGQHAVHDHDTERHVELLARAWPPARWSR